MRRLVLTVVLLSVGAWSVIAPPKQVAAFYEPALSGERGPDRDSYDLILLAPTHPVFIRLGVQVDGGGLKMVRFAYAAQLLKQYDRNGDGVLDQEESKRMPPLVKSANASETLSVSESWVSVDRGPADDKVTVEELTDWIDRIFGFPFSLAARPMRATQSIDLFGLLDANHDGRLTRVELADAERTLHKLDLDEDEAFTVDELQPLLSQQARIAATNPGRQSTDQPFLLLSDDESLRTAAAKLLQRYRPAEPNGLQGAGLSASSLGVDPAVAARFDTNQDGLLDEAEVQQFLKSPSSHVELAAQLLQSKPGRPTLQVVADRISAFATRDARRPDRLTLVAHGVGIEWRIPVQQRAIARDNRNLFKTKFLMADRDKNKYLDEQEFASAGVPNATFAQVDRNSDGMVIEDELLAVVDQEAASSQSRIDMVVTHDGSSVFEIIDRNVDRRLTRRELRGAVERMRKVDRDGNGEISTVELAGQFAVTLELGKPAEFRNQNAPRADGANTTPVVNRPTSGPDWFIKMDRNRDGDVSRREFLGPPALFRKLDTEGDGLISPAEAEQAATP
jgi:Ca2+-binding EF-hand superfamily protein